MNKEGKQVYKEGKQGTRKIIPEVIMHLYKETEKIGNYKYIGNYVTYVSFLKDFIYLFL